MMLFNSPELGDAERLALSHVERVQGDLTDALRVPRRWIGLFRRQTMARTIQASVQLSGLVAGLDDVLAAIDGDEPFDPPVDAHARTGLIGYHDAWTFMSQIAGDPSGAAGGKPYLDGSMLRALHFLLMHHAPGADPGRWHLAPNADPPTGADRAFSGAGPPSGADPPSARAEPASPADSATGAGPPSGADPLRAVAELASHLAGSDNPLIGGAMAHLGVVLAHPFRSGNGRVARLAHAMVVESHPGSDALWNGVEEYLASNAEVYRAVLAEVADRSGRWAGDPTPWIRFCLTAHYRQAAILLGRLQDAEKLWATCTLLAVDHDVPVRCVGALSEAAQGLRLRNATYRTTVRLSESPEQGEITEQTASRDLKALVECGLLNYMGEKRARIYRGGVMLRAAWAQVRSQHQGQGPLNSLGDPLAAGFEA